MNLRRLFPPVQSSTCAKCNLALRERKRKPCPRCGSTSRVLSIGLADGVHAVDRVA